VLRTHSSSQRRVLLAYTANELGTWFGYIALAVAVYDHTHSAIATAALFVAGRFLPAVAMPALVARVEASSRRGTLSVLYLVEGGLAGALAVLLGHFWLPGVLILVALDGTAAFTANALMRTAVVRIAAEEARAAQADTDGVALAQRKANAALNFAFSATVAGGPALAGVAVATVGGATALLIDAASFVVCAALVVQVRAYVEDDSGASVVARLAAGWRHLRTHPMLRALLLTQAAALVFFFSVEPVEVLYAKATLHAGDQGYGLLLAVWGVGMVLGSLIFARGVRRPLGPMLTIGTLAVGLAYLGWAAAPTLAWACVAALIGGTGNGVQWAALITAVQQLTPEALHGRLMAAVQAIMALCPAVGFSLGGALAALTSPRGAMLAAGLAATAATAMFARLGVGGLTTERGRGAPARPAARGAATLLSPDAAEAIAVPPVLSASQRTSASEPPGRKPVPTRARR
jgi:hypothetical protein